jgi:type IV secretory pathway ATPase VirB11/archaellum biosynthesis ATPase
VTNIENKNETKSNVVRLNKREQTIINFLRNVDRNDLSFELNKIYEKLAKEGYSCPNFKNFLSIISNKSNIFPMSYYISSNFLSQEQADLLKAAIIKNRNILITGDAATGKTCLMNTLLTYKKDKRMIVFDKYNRLNQDSQDDNIEIVNNDNFKISEILSKDIDTYVLEEVESKEDIADFLFMLNTCNGVIATTQYTGHTLLTSAGPNMAKYIKNTVNNSNLLEVHICIKNNSRMIDRIEEIKYKN